MTTPSPVLPVVPRTNRLFLWLIDTVRLTARGAWLTIKYTVFLPFCILHLIMWAIANADYTDIQSEPSRSSGDADKQDDTPLTAKPVNWFGDDMLFDSNGLFKGVGASDYWHGD